MKKILVCGAGGFIGGHLVRRLKSTGHWVRGVDIKPHDFSVSTADEFVLGDLREQAFARQVIDQPFDEIYQLAADMGGAGYLFSGDNDADVMYNSGLINLNVLERAHQSGSKKIFFSSSACIYPEYNQMDPDNPKCGESTAYPAAPDSEYGWEKIFSERLYLAYAKNHELDVRIGRFHNIFGEEGTWQGGKEKSPAAICRKVAEAEEGGSIDIWGDGLQTRSFLYVDECLEAVIRLMNSHHTDPVNIGSEEMITINQLANLVMQIADKPLSLNYVEGPQGVRGRTSDNNQIKQALDWAPEKLVSEGLNKTYHWILGQVNDRAESR